MVQPNHKGAWECDSRWNDWWASLFATLQISGDKRRSSCQRTASPLCCRSVLLQGFPCWNHLLFFFFALVIFFFFPIKHCLMFKNIETCSVSTIWSQNQHAPNSPITQLHPLPHLLRQIPFSVSAPAATEAGLGKWPVSLLRLHVTWLLGNIQHRPSALKLVPSLGCLQPRSQLPMAIPSLSPLLSSPRFNLCPPFTRGLCWGSWDPPLLHSPSFPGNLDESQVDFQYDLHTSDSQCKYSALKDLFGIHMYE